MPASPAPDTLRELALFGGLPDAGLSVFADLVEVVELHEGEAVFHEGDPARAIYVLAEGRLSVTKQRGGRECPIVNLLAGEMFGEMGFLDMQPRAGTVTALGDVVLWRWPYTAIRAVYTQDLKTYTMMVMNIGREVSRRLRRADEALLALQ